MCKYVMKRRSLWSVGEAGKMKLCSGKDLRPFEKDMSVWHCTRHAGHVGHVLVSGK